MRAYEHPLGPDIERALLGPAAAPAFEMPDPSPSGSATARRDHLLSATRPRAIADRAAQVASSARSSAALVAKSGSRTTVKRRLAERGTSRALTAGSTAGGSVSVPAPGREASNLRSPGRSLQWLLRLVLLLVACAAGAAVFAVALDRAGGGALVGARLRSRRLGRCSGPRSRESTGPTRTNAIRYRD